MEASSPAAPRTPMSVPAFGLARFGDERLARLVAGGNERAFAALYDRHHRRLYRYCRSIVRDDTDAQDALQSTFAGALVALRRGQRNAPVRPWLFRIAHNEAISVLRRRSGDEELSEASGRSVASAEDQAGDRERFTLLIADLRELPERLRGALLMRELSGLSHEEIAIALDTSAGAAKQAIFDARRGLAEFAEGRAMACEEIRRSISDGDGRVLRGRRVRAHLRACPSCAAFAAAIPARRGELQALVPALAPVASAAMLARLVGSGSGHGASGGVGALAAGAAGKTAGATIAAKTLVGAAILATAAVGVTGVTGVLNPTHHRPAPVRDRSAPAVRAAPAAPAAPAARMVRTTPAVGPATSTRSPGPESRKATRIHRKAPAEPRGRARTSHSGRVAPRASTISGTRHRGGGAMRAHPSHGRATPARTGGAGHRASPSVGRHRGVPPASRPVHRRRSTAGSRPASRPRPARSGTARSSHISGARASHRRAQPAPATAPVPPSRPAPSSPSARIRER